MSQPSDIDVINQLIANMEKEEKTQTEAAIAAANKIEQDAIAKRTAAWNEIKIKLNPNFNPPAQLCNQIDDISTKLNSSSLDKSATSPITEAGLPIDNAFGEGIQGGQPMTASGRNNDCLIHSFLTAMCDAFGTYPEWKRVFIADVFRREILPEFTALKQSAPVLKGKGFLSDDEAKLLAIAFNITIVLIVNSDTKKGRYMILCEVENSNEYIVINGNHTHFTPVKYMVGGKPTYKQTLTDIQAMKTKAEQIVNAPERKSTISWEGIVEDFKKDAKYADVSLLKGMYVSIIDEINKGLQSNKITEDEAKTTGKQLADIFKERLKAASGTNTPSTAPSGKQLVVTMQQNGKPVTITVGKAGEQGDNLTLGPFIVDGKQYFANKMSVATGGTRKRRSKQKKTRKRFRGLKR